jgi:nucleotide-binding universal stress UspA family protein
MLNIKKILLPVDFPNTSLEVVHQAATLAHHFHSEIVMLHVVTAQSHAAGVPEDGSEFAAWDVLAEITGTSLSGRSLMALPSDPHWSKATRPTPLCRWLRRKTPT